VTENDYRSLFLQSIARVHRDVLASLARDVLPKYKRAVKRSTILDASSPDKLPRSLQVALRRWARQFNLLDEWCLAVARETLSFWYRYPAQAHLARWALPGNVSGLSDDERLFELSDPGWRSGNWQQFETRMRKLMKESLLKYRERLLGPDVEKRILQHFDWLALYQCAGWTHRQIADEMEERSVGEDTVSKGIRKAAELVSITLRPGSRGPRSRK